jgi:hypothetical protein
MTMWGNMLIGIADDIRGQCLHAVVVESYRVWAFTETQKQYADAYKD